MVPPGPAAWPPARGTAGAAIARTAIAGAEILERPLDRCRSVQASSLSVTVEQRSADVVHLPGQAADPATWTVEDQVDVMVDTDGVWDPEKSVPVPAVVVRMPAHIARHLACVLDDWTTIGRILESARGTDERDLAGVLYEAARAAEALEADAS
jgi:hypothetical protein